MPVKTTRTNRIARWGLAAATLLAGGTVFGACELRLKDALVSSTQSLVLGLFSTALTDLNLDSTSSGTNTPGTGGG
jgi:hypothetical protein